MARTKQNKSYNYSQSLAIQFSDKKTCHKKHFENQENNSSNYIARDKEQSIFPKQWNIWKSQIVNQKYYQED